MWKDKLIDDIKKNKICRVINFIETDDCNIYIDFLTIKSLIEIASECENLEIKNFFEKIYNKKNELINAIKNNNLELVNSFFVEQSINLDLSTIYDAIETASEYGHLEIVKLYYENYRTFLLDHNSRITNALHNAFKNNHLNIIIYLINNLPDKIDDIIYKLANFYNNFEIINILSELEVNIYTNNSNNDNTIRLKSIYEDIINIKFLIKNNIDIHINNEEILRFASLCGNLKIVKYLIKNGANIHANDDEALRNTFYDEDKIMMFERCVNIYFNNNYDDSNYYYNDNNTYTISTNNLFLNKLRHRKIKIRKFLIENGANINANNGEILIKSIKNHNIHFIKHLIKNNVNIHINNDEAIRYASRIGCFNTIKLLLKNGANINANNDEVIINLFSNFNVKLKEIKFLVKNGANIRVNNDIVIRIATKNGDLEIIKYLIKNGANIHANNDEALRIAVVNRSLKIVQYLIKNGANINNLDNIENEYIDEIKYDLINWASINGNLNVIKYFDENSQIIYKYKYMEIFHNAAKNGHLEIVKYLKNRGVNIHDKDDYALRITTENGHLKIVKYLIENGANIHANNNEYGEGAIIIAVEKGHLEVIKYLIENGADIHTDDDLVIICAVENGHLEIVKYLIENGVDINAKSCGNEVITIASEKGHLEVVKYLIENGANIHINNEEILQNASKNGNCNMVKLLIENDANINANDDNALRIATKYGHLKVVKYLIDNGANIHINNDEILRNASRIGNFYMVKLLIENGANIHANNNESLKYSIKNKHNKVKKLLIDNYKFHKKPIDMVIRGNIDNTCMISYEKLEEDDIKIICSNCNNIFSKENILKWLYAENINSNRICPLRCKNSEFYEL